MKYEMTFGDAKLFDGAPKDAEAVTCVDGFNKLYYKFFFVIAFTFQRRTIWLGSFAVLKSLIV